MTTLLQALANTEETRWRHKPNIEVYHRHVTGILKLMGITDIPLDEINQGWVELVRSTVRRSEKRASSANRRLASFRSVLNLAGVKVSLPPLPVQINGGARHFTDEELKLVDSWFRNVCNSNVVKAYYAVLRDTGARGLEELSKVTTNDINFETREITLRSNKGSRGDTVERKVWLTEVSERALSWLINQEVEPLFNNGTFTYFRAFFTDMRQELFDGDTRIKPYSLRHTFAMRLHKKGVSIHAIAKVMGHASIQTTLSYLHTDQEDKDDILAALA